MSAVHRLLTWLVEPGFTSSGPVHVALAVGTVAATVSAVVGVFTVLRGQSFAGHALTDVAAAGGSGALLFGAGALSGFVVGGLLGAGAMDLVGVQRARGRDLATGVVLGVATGVTALVLYLDTTTRATAGSVQQVLFGSIFSVDAAVVPLSVALGTVAVAAVGALYRPLLLSSVDPDMAAARGVPTRAVGVVFMGALSLAVGLSAVAIGAILSTALLIGPAAAALRATRRLGWAVATAVVIGTAATSLGVLLAYDSYYWAPGRRGLPVSFFVVALVVAAYGLSGLPARRRRGAPGPAR